MSFIKYFFKCLLELFVVSKTVTYKLPVNANMIDITKRFNGTKVWLCVDTATIFSDDGVELSNGSIDISEADRKTMGRFFDLRIRQRDTSTQLIHFPPAHTHKYPVNRDHLKGAFKHSSIDGIRGVYMLEDNQCDNSFVYKKPELKFWVEEYDSFNWYINDDETTLFLHFISSSKISRISLTIPKLQFGSS